jgi:hypothetical protein
MATNREEFLSDVLITAVEGGINYWASVSEYKPQNNPSSVRVHEFDEDTGEYIEPGVLITTKEIGAVVKRIMDPDDDIKYVDNHTRSIVFQGAMEDDAGEIDADIADAIMQIAVLGEIVYG